MSRARLISPEFWTSEAVVDCAPMTRLLLLGLANFADDFGVLPLRPRTVRLQVFPGDAIDDDQVRAMLDELIARGLLRRYTVDGVDYLAIVDWEIHQRVGRHARRRYPADPSVAAPPVPDAREAAAGPADPPSAPDHGKPWQSPSAAAPDPRGETEPPPDAAAWPDDGADDLAAKGRDFTGDVAPAIDGATLSPTPGPFMPASTPHALAPTM